MRLNEIAYTGAPPIDSYGPGFFRVAGVVYARAVILASDGVREWSGYNDRAPLVDLAGVVDILFVGTGAETSHLPKDFLSELEGCGLAVEAMASPAACRTYNVLLSEGRRVGAALLTV